MSKQLFVISLMGCITWLQPGIARSEMHVGDTVIAVRSQRIATTDEAYRSSFLIIDIGDIFVLRKVEPTRAQIQTSIASDWVDRSAFTSMEEGEKLMTQWITQRQNLPYAYFGRAQILAWRGKLVAAISDMTTALSLTQDKTKFLNERGKMHFRCQEFAKALADFDSAAVDINDVGTLSMRSLAANIYYHRGVTRFEMKDYRRAIEDFDRACGYLSKYVYPVNRRGMTWIKLGEHEHALKDFDTAIKIDPDFSAPYLFHAQTLENLGRYPEAIEGYEKAIALSPQSAFIIGSVSSDLYLRLSLNKSSSTEEYWRLDSKFSPYICLARLLIQCPDQKLRNPSRALELINKISASDHDRYFEFAKTEALALISLGRRSAAKDSLQRAIKVAPQSEAADLQKLLTEQLDQ